MKFLQYRVDFTPEIDHPGVKKALIRVHEQMRLFSSFLTNFPLIMPYGIETA
jgi:hypothetical protein